MRQEYIPPAVEDLGSLQEMTLGTAPGLGLDADFSIGSQQDVPFS